MKSKPEIADVTGAVWINETKLAYSVSPIYGSCIAGFTKADFVIQGHADSLRSPLTAPANCVLLRNRNDVGRIFKSAGVGVLTTFVITFVYLAFGTIRLRRNMPGAGAIGYDPVSIIRQGWPLFLAMFLVGFFLAWHRFK